MGGVKHAIQLLTYLSRILPEADVVWRIERRLLGFEPFTNFEESNPHAKAIILKGRLELAVILEKRKIDNSTALQNIGDALASIASDMQSALPLLNSILDNVPVPDEDCSISGWSYNKRMRSAKLIDIFTDLSVLYASLHEVLLSGLKRATDISFFLGPKCHRILTARLISIILSSTYGFPKQIVRSLLELICTILSKTMESNISTDIDITAEDRNAAMKQIEEVSALVNESILSPLEALVQEDYSMWGKRRTNTWLKKAEDVKSGTAERVGSEKVEALARCYAHLLRTGKATWAAIEAKATEPYSFSQFWKHANLTYRNFSLYLLSHTLEHAPGSLEITSNLPSILRMWLISVLDYGKHQCSWYLTRVLSTHLHDLFPGEVDKMDFRSDIHGDKRYALLHHFGNAIVSSGRQSYIATILLDLDDFLFEKQKEISLSAFNPDKAILQWQRATLQAIMGLLEGLSPLLTHRNLAGSQLRRLCRRCAVWMVDCCKFIRHLCQMQPQKSVHSPSLEDDLEFLATEGDIRQELEGSAFSLLPSLLPFVDLLRRQQDEAGHMKEFLEPVWVLIAGCVEMGSGNAVVHPFDAAMFDKLACYILHTSFASLARGETSRLGQAHQVPLNVYILSTFIRRYVQRASYRHTSNETFAMNAIRLTCAMFARTEMRSQIEFELAFYALMPTLLIALSKGNDGDSLAVKDCLVQLLQIFVLEHPEIVLPASSSKSFNLLTNFWACVCKDSINTVNKRFPSDTMSETLMNAEYMYCRIVKHYPDARLYTPDSGETLTDTQNMVLSQLGRPLSLSSLESIYSTTSISDLLRADPADLTSNLTPIRPGDFGWSVARRSLQLLATIARAQQTPEDTNSVGKSILKKGALFALNCYPYLSVLLKKFPKVATLVREEFHAVESLVFESFPEVWKLVNEIYQEEENSKRHLNAERKTETLLNSFHGLEDIELGSIATFQARLIKVRKLGKNGVQAAVATLVDLSDSKRFVNFLVPRPDDLVNMIIRIGSTEKLPLTLRIEGAELARKHSSESKIPVFRSMNTTKYVEIDFTYVSVVSKRSFD